MRINKNSSYYRNLIRRVIDNSEKPVWEDAVFEWEVYDCEDDEALHCKCHYTV